MENKYYTYAYLSDNRTPYYIGCGCGNRAYRHCNPYDARVPEREMILILKSGLTQAEAWKHEEYMIYVLGRKSDGGVLDNKARGGRGWGGGSPATDTRKQKIGSANRGRVLSIEHKRKLSEAKLGKKPTPSTIASRAKGCRRSISLCSPEGDTLTFESSKACASFLSVDQSSIAHLKRGDIKSVKGYSLA